MKEKEPVPNAILKLICKTIKTWQNPKLLFCLAVRTSLDILDIRPRRIKFSSKSNKAFKFEKSVLLDVSPLKLKLKGKEKTEQ